MSVSTLTFDPAAHRYTYGGRELLSVTTALKEAGLVDGAFYTDAAASRGTAVHAAVDRFRLDGTVPTDDVVAPFFDAYLAFQQDSGFVTEASEVRVCDPLRGYAGTLDLLGRFVQQPAGTDLIDIKTGTVPAWVGYQTAAYARLVPGLALPGIGGPVRRWALQLRATGGYRLVRCQAPTDESVFLAALLVAQAKRGWL